MVEAVVIPDEIYSDRLFPVTRSVKEKQTVQKQVGPLWSRRRFLKALGVGAGTAALGVGAIPGAVELGDQLGFITGREALSYEQAYLPPDPEHVLSQEVSQQIFESLNLAEQFPNTLSQESFHLLSQKVARLASLYFYPEDKANQNQEFIDFCEGFFKKMLDYSNFMQLDFGATLLMFQVSGANTSSVRAQRADVRDERVRVGMSLGHDLVGEKAPSFLIDTLRNLNLGSYYAMARLEGPVTLGIHDVEIVMIARALKNLEQNLPEQWLRVAKYLQTRAPEFFERYGAYVDSYSEFDQLSDEITKQVEESDELQQYLQQFQNHEQLKGFLATNNTVDAYQLSRTTTYWATVSELDQLISTSGYVPRRETLEQQALEKTIATYLETEYPTGFFLDQICNPKMIIRLEKDAQIGNLAAKKLLEMSHKINQVGDKVITEDRGIATAIIEEDLEQDLEFQMITGVAYARWLLQDAFNHTSDEPAKQLEFTNSHELAWLAFLGNGNRETAPSYQLAGSRPLQRATLPFGRPQVLFETMSQFVSQVYQEFEQTHPREDFKIFARHISYLIEEIYFKNMVGVPRFKLNDDEKVGQFIAKAEEFGAYRNIITPPHCSWIRAMEATVAYITSMS